MINLDGSPKAAAFRESPWFLRPHALYGVPSGTESEAVEQYSRQAARRGQLGMSFSPDWNRWNDPTLFTDEDYYWRKLGVSLDVVRREGGFAWIYDEPGFPSGTAGMRTMDGHPELQATAVEARWIDVTRGPASLDPGPGTVVFACAARLSEGRLDLGSLRSIDTGANPLAVAFEGWDAPWRLMAFCEIPLHEGTFTWKRHEDCVAAGEYLPEHGGPPNWKDNRYSYPNLLNPKSTSRLIEVAYQPYLTHAEDFLGREISAFFVDEPHVPHRDYQPGKLAPIVPWESELERLFLDRYGSDLRRYLPALFFDCGGEEIRPRCDFYQLIADTFAESFVIPLNAWCIQHGLRLTGHFLGEEWFAHHIAQCGSLLRCLREMSMPGMDYLGAGFVGHTLFPSFILGYTEVCGATVPKIVSSAAHLQGIARTMSESHCFSSPDTGTTLSEYVAVANWETVLGINSLPYFFLDWFDPSEDRRYRFSEHTGLFTYKDAAGATSEQQVRYSEYAGRLAYMTTGGIHRADVAILYPIASAWRAYSPLGAKLDPLRRLSWTHPDLDRLQSVYEDASRSLLEHQIDFDYLDESDIQTAQVNSGRLAIGDERFRVVVLPGAAVASVETLRVLERFRVSGGMIAAVTPIPAFGRRFSEDDEVRSIAGRWSEEGRVFVTDDPYQVGASVQRSIACDVLLNPSFEDVYVLHRVRGDNEIYFLANNGWMTFSGSVRFRTGGEARLWNAWTGRVFRLAGRDVDGYCELALTIPGHCACFVVFGPCDDSGELPTARKEDMGPKTTDLRDRARWLEESTRERYFGQMAPRRMNCRSIVWTLCAPDSSLSAAKRGETTYELTVPPWHRLGSVYEGLLREDGLAPGVYEIRIDVCTENLDMWTLFPRHYGGDQEIIERGADYSQPRHHFTMPGSPQWIEITFHFRVPADASRTELLLQPLNKRFSSRRSVLTVRNTTVSRLSSAS